MDEKVIPVVELRKFVEAVFLKAGVPQQDATICTDVLIASDLRGIESHGISRLKMYYDRIKSGIQFPETKIDVIRDGPTTAVWDGNHGMGQVIGYRAMEAAIEKAAKYRHGICSGAQFHPLRHSRLLPINGCQSRHDRFERDEYQTVHRAHFWDQANAWHKSDRVWSAHRYGVSISVRCGHFHNPAW